MRYTDTGSLEGVQLRLGQARPPTFQRAIARAGLGAHVTVDVAVDAIGNNSTIQMILSSCWLEMLFI